MLANHLLANAKALVFAGKFLGNEKWYKKGMAIYKKELPEQTCADGVNFDGVMYADPDAAGETKGVVFLFKPSPDAGESCRVTLRGLIPDVSYDLSFEDRPEQNVTLTGEELMQSGIDVAIDGIGSELIFITETK